MKNSHAWLDALARTAREEDVVQDPRWDMLAAGQLDPEGEAALLQLAQQSSTAAAAYEAFRPSSDAQIDGIVEQILQEPGAGAGEQDATGSAGAHGTELIDVPAAGAAAGPHEQAPAAIIPLLRRRRVLITLTGAVALASGIAGWIYLNRTVIVDANSLAPALTSGDALPVYTMEVYRSSGSRGAGKLSPDGYDVPAKSVWDLGPGSGLGIILRPVQAVQGEVVVSGVLVNREASGVRKVLMWLPQFGRGDGMSGVVGRDRVRLQSRTILPDGSISVFGSREVLFPNVPDGLWEVVIAVGRPEALPSDPEVLATMDPLSGSEIKVFRVQVLLTAGSGVPAQSSPQIAPGPSAGVTPSAGRAGSASKRSLPNIFTIPPSPSSKIDSGSFDSWD
ncbi:hypothetical protein [Sorangium sp. So ce385]|uniref:hypothetical protein n=1 Tax=Sorangium sp. So ce385 TaxID=3133308 RepID=UPI003F5C281F